MNNSHINSDLICSLLQLDQSPLTYKAREFRKEVLIGTQESYDAIFNPELSLNLDYRWLIATYASQLSKSIELTEHYAQQVNKNHQTYTLLPAILNDDLTTITDPIIKAMLVFTKTLILNPIEGDKKALLALENSGVSIPDCIALAQLIAFLSYQIRLITGLKAMKDLEKQL